MSFDDLRSNFQTIRIQFDEAKAIEEKLRLIVISQRIILEANAEIAEFKREFLSY